MTGLITAGNAAWCLVLAMVLHILIAGRVGAMIPAKVGTAVLPRAVSTLTFAGLAGLTVATVGVWLHRQTTSAAGWSVSTLHIPLGAQTVVAALAAIVTISAVTGIAAGHAVSGRFMAECVLAAALLAAIPGHAGQFLSAVIRALVRVGAFVVAAVFGVV